MYDIIFPRHFEYRVVRCKVSNIAVWNHFTIHRALALNVRRLEILDERSTESALIPSDIVLTDTDVESSDDELGVQVKQEKLLTAALSKMTSLGEFVWSCNHSLISLHEIWPTLFKFHSLESVELNDNIIFGPTANDSESSSAKRRLVVRDRSYYVRQDASVLIIPNRCLVYPTSPSVRSKMVMAKTKTQTWLG